jgi:parvulin-like peptidyl-prolyl isomerase
MEMMFFNANVGDVLGPLFIDDYAMIFKVVGFDTLYKSRISHIYIQPDGKSKKDTLQALKKANQYLAKIQKGEDFAQLATKYGNDATAKNGGDMGWLWEGTMVKEFEEAVAKAKKGDVFVLQTPVGAHVVKLTEDKVRDIGRIRLIPVVKKI